MIKKYRDKIIIGGIIILFGVIGYFYDGSNSSSNNNDDKSKFKAEDSTESTVKRKIFVHVDGAVNKPGLYEFNNSDRVDDALKKAGNIVKDADLKNVNLAEKLEDEMKIYIPMKNIENENNSLIENSNNESTDLINLNSASKEELMTLLGIGDSKASAIIEYRENTNFSKIEDLLNVSGIGEKTFEKLKEFISIY